MNFHKLRIQIVLLVFLIAVVIGLGATYFYEQTQVIIPLHTELQKIPGVSSVNVEQSLIGNGTRTLVKLELAEDIPLSVVLTDVREVLEDTRGNYALQLKESVDGQLISLFSRIQIAAEEAIITGEFTALEERVQTLAQSEQVEWNLAIDRDYIYLSLINGDSYLQRVISRDANEGKVIVLQGGGVVNG